MDKGIEKTSGGVGASSAACSRRCWRQSLAAIAVLLAALALCSSPAYALSQRGHAFGGSFETSGENKLSAPSAVAVNEATGDIYVVDKANNRVVRFNSNHEFLEAWGEGVNNGAEAFERCTKAEEAKCKAGKAGLKTEQFSSPTAIAVDNASGSPSKGDVYVVANRTWKKAVVEKFSSEGVHIATLNKKLEEKEEAEGAIDGVAVDSGGSVWIEREDEEEAFLLERFNSEASNKLEELEEFEVPEVVAGSRPTRPGFAIDPAGDIYITYEPGGADLLEEEEAIEEREEARKEKKEEPKHEQPQPPCQQHTCLVAKLRLFHGFGDWKPNR